MRLFFVLMFFLLFNAFAFSQATISHKVLPKETLYGISKKYGVSIDEIKANNPEVANGELKIDQVLIIKKSNSNSDVKKEDLTPKTTDSQSIVHIVKPKETLFGISKMYGVSIDELKAKNPEVTVSGLKIGQELIVKGLATKSEPKTENIKIENTKTESAKTENTKTEKLDFSTITHIVKAKETLFGISKLYGISVDLIKKYNPSINPSGLKIGDSLILPTSSINNQYIREIDNDVATISSDFENQGIDKTKEYIVQEGESIYSVSDKMRTTIEQIVAVNPDLRKNGLYSGQKLKHPITNKTNFLLDGYIAHLVENNESLEDLTNYLQTTKEELLLNNPKIEKKLENGYIVKLPVENFSYIKQAEVVKKNNNGFVDILMILPLVTPENTIRKPEQKVSLDFYLGAKLAVEEIIKNSNKKIRIKILDSSLGQESLINELDKIDFSTIDVLVGPMFELNISSVLLYLRKNKIPVVSPIINTNRLLYNENLIMSEPREEDLMDNLIKILTNNFVENRVVIFTKESNLQNANLLKQKISFLTKEKIPIEIVNNPLSANLQSSPIDKLLIVNYTSDNIFGQNVMNQIAKSEYTNTRVFGLGYIDYYNAFEKENYKNLVFLTKLKFTYFTNHFLNEYGDEEKRIIKDFKDSYCVSPNKFMATGYDLVYDLIDRMDENGNLTKWSESEKRLSTKFNYIKTVTGATRNTGVRMIKF